MHATVRLAQARQTDEPETRTGGAQCRRYSDTAEDNLNELNFGCLRSGRQHAVPSKHSHNRSAGQLPARTASFEDEHLLIRVMPKPCSPLPLFPPASVRAGHNVLRAGRGTARRDSEDIIEGNPKPGATAPASSA